MAEEITITAESIIPEILQQRIKLHPNRIALIEGEQRVAYAEFGAQVGQLAAVLRKLGVQPGEKVALLLPNGIRFTVATYAIFHIGAVVVAVNPTYKAPEIRHLLHDSEAVAVIVAEKFPGSDPLGRLREVRDELPHLRYALLDGQHAPDLLPLENLLTETKALPEYHRSRPEDVAALLYTSGTTGAPKGSIHTHRTLLFPLTINIIKTPTFMQLFTMVRRFGFGYLRRLLKVFGKPITVLVTTPPYAGAGLAGPINMLLGGRISVLQDRFSTTEAIQLIEKEKVNVFGAVPALATLMLRDPEINNHDLNSLIYFACGASFVSPSLVREVRQVIGVPTMIGYGATELIGAPTLTDPFSDSEKALHETVGRVAPGYEFKIVDEHRQPLPVGEIGEIAIRGNSLMLGYYKAEALTRQVIDQERWFYTGDLGSFDDQGYLRIHGRIKDMIIRAGQNIYPPELEQVLSTHPKIHMAAVVGVPDDIAGEKVVAYVIPKDSQSLTQEEVMSFCVDNLAPYKIPRNVYFVDEFPMTPTGKVLKRVLREQALEWSRQR
jgi:acyl-CoA synthetase (AMP-forming)/AMP-acid ligase II